MAQPPALDPNFFISTPRLNISYFLSSVDSHCDFLVAVHNSPESLAVHKGKGFAKPTSGRDAARKNLQENEEMLARTGYGKYIVSLKPTIPGSNEVIVDERPFSERAEESERIGVVTMNGRERDCVIPVPDLGFNFLASHWGRGYATEAAQGLLDYYEREMGKKEFFGFCDPTNESSKNVFRRLGFEERGERVLKGLGPPELNCLVWARKGMSADLAVYGI